MTVPHLPTTYRTKVIVVGESAVGKTSLCQVVTSDVSQFPRNYNFTFGFELFVKMYEIGETGDNVELHLVDCSACPIYQELLSESLPQNSLMCYVLDVTSRASFDKLPSWLNKCQSNSAKNMPGLLLANKSDLSNRKFVTESTANQWATNNKLTYFETSAKENINLHEAFRFLAEEWYKKIKQ